jgi:glycerophosphoryl diester phosphodiesterase
MRIKKRRTIVGAISDFKRTWAQLLLIGCAMRLTAALLLLLVLAVAVRVLMATQGETAFDDAEIFAFFLSLPGIIALIIAGVLWIGVAFVEQAALMAIGYGAIDRRRLGWLGALRYVGSKLGVLLPLGCHLLARVLMVVAPFIVAAVLVFHIALGRHHSFFDEQDVYYFLYHLPPGIGWAVATVVLLLGAMLFLLSSKVVRWLLAIPAVLFEDLGPVAAIKDSVKDSKGHRWQLAGLLTLWISAGAIAGVVGTFLIGMAGRSALSLAGDSPASITFTIGATGFVSLVFYALVSLFAMALFAFSAVRVYRDCSGPGALPAIDGETDLSESAGVSLSGGNILLGVAGVMAVAGLSAFFFASGLENPAEPVAIIAHKGASAIAPENTLDAVEKAIEARADFVEIDVQLTKDSEIIVFHDAVINLLVKDDGSRVASFYLDGIGLKKTAEGRIDRAGGKISVVAKRSKKDPWEKVDAEMSEKGEWLYINDLTYEQLKDIDVGSWWVDRKTSDKTSEGKFGEEFLGATIPTLDQVLIACHEGRTKVVIELKYDGEFDQPELARRVAETVRNHGMQDEVVVMSFSAARLEQMQILEPDWTYGQSFTFRPRRADILDELDFVALHKRGVRRGFLSVAKRSELEVYVFTMNDPFGMSAMFSRGVDGIITDEPELARSVLEFRTELNPLQRLLVATGAEVGMFSIFQ